ncbi:MAG: ferritin family protein [Deltaproteobacteria bacterium]|nr:ferritin family protein [Deltaproteobacteria bacterium]
MTADNKIIAELEKAYRTEIAGHLFYIAAADMTADDKGRNVFTHLANEEFDHIRVVSSIAYSVKNGKGWVDFDEALRSGSRIKRDALPIFPDRETLVARLKKNQTGLNAVNIGIESEEAAVDFYSHLLKAARGPVEKVVLTRLLEMEKGHLKMLRWEAESLAKTGFWCGDMEYSVEKEAD